MAISSQAGSRRLSWHSGEPLSLFRSPCQGVVVRAGLLFLYEEPEHLDQGVPQAECLGSPLSSYGKALNPLAGLIGGIVSKEPIMVK